jgi:hypothetical protein
MAIQKLFSSLSKSADFATYVGQKGRIFSNDATGEIRISDGVTPGGRPVYVAVTNANIGNLVITGSTIEALNANEDLNLSTNGDGNVNVYGSFKVHADGIGSSVSFDAAASGLLTMTVPTLTLGQTGLLINGGSTATTSLPQVSGTTFRSVGNDGMTNTVAVDAFGTGAFPAFIHRAGRGTSAAPTATKNGDTIGRWGAVGWGDTNFVIDQGLGRAASDIRFVATEDFTDAHGGTKIQFFTSPNGGTARTLSATIDYTGITVGNITAANATISGTTTFNGPSVFSGLITSNGGRISNGDSTFNGNLLVNGLTTFNGNVTHTGDTTFGGNLTINHGLIVNGDTIHQGNLTVDGTLNVAGNEVITKQIVITAAGNIAFNDGTVQTTASIKQINNLDHITGALGFSGNTRTLNLSSDATPTNTVGTIVARDAAGNIAVGNIAMTAFNTSSLTSNSSVAGSLTVYGNLNVVGTTVTTNAVVTTVDTKTFTIASNAVSAIAADGAAYLVGNIAGSSIADWTYDNGQTAWRSNISVVPAQNDTINLGSSTRNWNNIFASNAYVTNKLNVGTLPIENFNTIAQFTGNVSSWSQVTNQNTSSNIYASSDYVAINDVGTDVVNYIDMGINSSTNADPAYSIMKANDGYMYVNGGNLALGTQTLGKDIVFFTDDTIASKEAGRVHLGRWLIGQPVDDGTTRVQVNGNIVAGNVNATNLTNQFATLTANAATQANQITGANAAIVTANTAVVSYVNTLNTAMIANVVAANAAIVTANTAMKSYVDAVTTAWTANAATQQVSINSLATNANANTSAYLSNGISSNIVTTGNITAGNVTATNFFGTATQVSNSLTAGYGLKLSSGTTYNGSTALTINKYDAITSATATGSGNNGWTYSLDLGTANGTVIVDAGGNFSGTVTITGTPIAGKVVRLIVIGGLKGATTVTVSGLTAGNSSNGLNTFTATSGTASSVIVEFISSTTALGGVYMNTSGAK